MRERFKKDPQTDADVRHLLTVFADLLPDGRTVAHTQIEAALTANRAMPRYHTAVRKWRRVLLTEKSIYLDGVAANGAGFIALTPDEMVRFGNRGVRLAGRKLQKALAVMSVPADVALSEDMRRYRARLSVAVEQIATHHRTALRDVTRALTQTTRTLPRRLAG